VQRLLSIRYGMSSAASGDLGVLGKRRLQG
jgi:hypothetical protein